MSETAETGPAGWPRRGRPEGPCGPQSSCCGPVGQSVEEVGRYVEGLRATLPGVHVETVDVSKKLNVRDHGPVVKLLNTFGANACPIFTVGAEVVSMGPPAIPEVVQLLRGQLAAAQNDGGK